MSLVGKFKIRGIPLTYRFFIYDTRDLKYRGEELCPAIFGFENKDGRVSLP